MSGDELEAYLHSNIPLTAAMAIQVRALEPELVLCAPLAPNLNHQCNAFGGSIATVAITAGWSWLRLRLGAEHDIVIKSCEIEYVSPVREGFEAICKGSSEGEFGRFMKRLDRKGRARISLKVEVHSAGLLRAKMVGEYVALGGRTGLI